LEENENELFFEKNYYDDYLKKLPDTINTLPGKQIMMCENKISIKIQFWNKNLRKVFRHFIYNYYYHLNKIKPVLTGLRTRYHETCKKIPGVLQIIIFFRI